jgi:hypothetical protein
VKQFPTSVRLPEDLKRDLEAECKRDSRSMSWLIVHVLRRWQAYQKAKGKKNSGL